MDIALGISYNVRTNEAWPQAASAFHKGWSLCSEQKSLGIGQAAHLIGNNSLSQPLQQEVAFLDALSHPTPSKYQMT